MAEDRITLPNWLLTAGLAVAAWALSAYVGYAAASSEMNARVSVLESQWQTFRADLSEVKQDVKTLLRRP
jgi:hypothetical protein